LKRSLLSARIGDGFEARTVLKFVSQDHACMTSSDLDKLRRILRESRAYMLAAVVGLPEALLQEPGVIGPYSVAQQMAIRIEAENRALTLIQSMYHGRPFAYPIPREELDRKAVYVRWGWDWDHLMRELYQQREETMWNLEDFEGPILHHHFDVHGQHLSPYEVLVAVAEEERILGEKLWAWRKETLGL